MCAVYMVKIFINNNFLKNNSSWISFIYKTGQPQV